jgi:hypothetical protein
MRDPYETPTAHGKNEARDLSACALSQRYAPCKIEGPRASRRASTDIHKDTRVMVRARSRWLAWRETTACLFGNALSGAEDIDHGCETDALRGSDSYLSRFKIRNYSNIGQMQNENLETYSTSPNLVTRQYFITTSHAPFRGCSYLRCPSLPGHSTDKLQR